MSAQVSIFYNPLVMGHRYLYFTIPLLLWCTGICQTIVSRMFISYWHIPLDAPWEAPRAKEWDSKTMKECWFSIDRFHWTLPGRHPEPRNGIPRQWKNVDFLLIDSTGRSMGGTPSQGMGFQVNERMVWWNNTYKVSCYCLLNFYSEDTGKNEIQKKSLFLVFM